jgi:hypothetical protein
MTDHPELSLINEGDRDWGERIREDRASSDQHREDRTWRDCDASRSDARRGPGQPPGDGASETDTGDAETTPREQIRELEDELERSEHRVQRVIDHYERLLADKNRELEAESGETTDDSFLSLLAALWRRAN